MVKQLKQLYEKNPLQIINIEYLPIKKNIYFYLHLGARDTNLIYKDLFLVDSTNCSCFQFLFLSLFR